MTPRQKLAATTATVAPDRFPLGAARMDVLLDGGLRTGDVALIHGPAFLGKSMLARIAIRAAIANEIPAIVITTRKEGHQLLAEVAHDEKAHEFIRVIDTCSASIGGHAVDGVRLVDGPSDLNGLAAAVNDAQAAIQGKHDHHLLVIDSLSTLVAHNNVEAVFRFLQVLAGASRRAGGHAVVTMDDAMHDPHQVETFKHLCAGTIQVRDVEGKHQVRILGFDVANHLGWIDYRSTDESFDVIGSFAAGRIR